MVFDQHTCSRVFYVFLGTLKELLTEKKNWKTERKTLWYFGHSKSYKKILRSPIQSKILPRCQIQWNVQAMPWTRTRHGWLVWITQWKKSGLKFCIYVDIVISNIPVGGDYLSSLREHLKADNTCSTLMKYLTHGWPDKSLLQGELRKYWTERAWWPCAIDCCYRAQDFPSSHSISVEGWCATETTRGTNGGDKCGPNRQYGGQDSAVRSKT